MSRWVRGTVGWLPLSDGGQRVLVQIPPNLASFEDDVKDQLEMELRRQYQHDLAEKVTLAPSSLSASASASVSVSASPSASASPSPSHCFYAGAGA